MSSLFLLSDDATEDAADALDVGEDEAGATMDSLNKPLWRGGRDRGAKGGRGVDGQRALDRLVPTGYVVGILERRVGEVVATVPLIRDPPPSAVGGSRESSREMAVLVAPVDRRLPRIRVRTRQVTVT